LKTPTNNKTHMANKTEFSFRVMDGPKRIALCPAPVAAAVRRSAKRWIVIRFDKQTSKAAGLKTGTLLTTFIDEGNRALLLLSDQRPIPPCSRRVYGKEAQCFVELPRQGILEEWFQPGPIRPMNLVEVSPGRILITVP
jgi:hypothetical protein